MKKPITKADNKFPCPICGNWARADGFLTKHHPVCRYYDPVDDAKEIIVDLLRGIRAWAADEDGIHPELCDAYDRAAIATSEMPLKKEG